MTTIVGAARGGIVHMAADSCTNVYDVPLPGAATKIIRRHLGDREEMLLGVTGSAGLAQVLADPVLFRTYRVDELTVDDELDSVDRVAFTIARKVTAAAVDAKLLEDGRMDSNVLLGWRGRLWTIAHMCAIPHPDGIAALGSGHGFAFGAVDALLGTGVDAEDAVARACLIAIERDRYSAGPIQVESLVPADAAAA
ncbi:hypothetical protein [Dactylosporangium sp. CS-033363]|uniref:hypothetical protein n=1 Tax=Dactylosporangium sp. CS-033363 TaxID=3239935 RepID=UPI003D8DAAA0